MTKKKNYELRKLERSGDLNEKCRHTKRTALKKKRIISLEMKTQGQEVVTMSKYAPKDDAFMRRKRNFSKNYGR